MSKRALGYKRDAHDPNDYSADLLLGRAPGAALVPASLLPFCIGNLVQGNASSCVANAIAKAIDVSLRFKQGGTQTTSWPPHASRRFLYANARIAENTGGKQRPLLDEGCYPRLAMSQAQHLGVCTEDVFPYTDKQQAPGASPIGTINEIPPPAAYRAAFDQADFNYYRISSTGEQRAIETAQALALGHPICFGLFVDTAFMDWDGKTPINAIDTNDPNGGGHMITAVSVDAGKVTACNWWDTTWGRNGYADFTHSLYGSDVVSDIYIIETVSDFPRTP